MVSKMLNSERHISNKREQTGKFTKPTYLLKLTEQSQTAKVGLLENWLTKTRRKVAN